MCEHSFCNRRQLAALDVDDDNMLDRNDCQDCSIGLMGSTCHWIIINSLTTIQQNTKKVHSPVHPHVYSRRTLIISTPIHTQSSHTSTMDID